MSKPNHLPAVVPASGGALTTTPGTQRIATRMADDLLAAVALSRKSVLAEQRRYRIGEYEFREADHAQIQRWARMLGIEVGDMVAGLRGLEQLILFPDETARFQVQNGAIARLTWDFDTFPLAEWAWGDGLKIERMDILNHQKGRLPTLPRSLRVLFCDKCELTVLDLAHVPELTELNCSSNQLTDLDLTPVPGLTHLDCSRNHLTYLDLTPVPELTTLVCNMNELTELDLTPVPGLTKLDCIWNHLTHLDLTPVPGLTSLNCNKNPLCDLDLTPVPGLTTLSCDRNQLANLDLTPVPGLTKLDCIWNHLTHLDLTPVPGLIYLNCDPGVRLTGIPRNLKVTHNWHRLSIYSPKPISPKDTYF